MGQWSIELLLLLSPRLRCLMCLAAFRSIMGVHYRYDSTEGIILGETYAVRLLHQVRTQGPRSVRSCPGSASRKQGMGTASDFRRLVFVVVRLRAFLSYLLLPR